MRDLEINIGYVGGDIIALCEDIDASYSFIAVPNGDHYDTRMMSSMSGLVVSTSYAIESGARQMVMGALVNYWAAMEKVADQEQAKLNALRQTSKHLN